MDPILLILDLDETLIHTEETKPDGAPGIPFDRFWITPRPHLDAFLQNCFRTFQVAIWSAGTEDYVASIVRQFFPQPERLVFVWSRERCVYRFNPETMEHYYRKDLRKVINAGFLVERILVLDDSRPAVECHYGNHVPIKPFEGDMTDNELQRLWPHLAKWVTRSDVREIDKRQWHWAPDWL